MTVYDGLSTGYDRGMLPLELLFLRRLRRRLYPFVTGQTLELGVGTGVNLPLYDPSVHLVALDASLHMLQQARRRRNDHTLCVQADAESLPFADASFDHVVGSLVFCSIGDPARSLGEVHRILRPGGWLVLLEHVRGERGLARLLTDRLARPWLRLSKSCNLNRDTAATVRSAGFRLVCSSRHAFGILQVILARNV